MTRREYCHAMLLDDAHPETWSESDRDAYLRWRLADYSAWARTCPKRDRLTYYRAVIRGSVRAILDERQQLYRPRYRRCTCTRCIKPFISQAELDALLTRRPDLRRLTPATGRALAHIDRFRAVAVVRSPAEDRT